MIDYYYLIVQVYHVIHLIEMYNVVQIHLYHVLIGYIHVEVLIFVVQDHLYVVEENVPIQILNKRFPKWNYLITLEPNVSSRALRSVCVKSICLVTVANSWVLALRRD